MLLLSNMFSIYIIMLKNDFYQCSSIILKNIKIRKEDAPILRAGGYNDHDNDCVRTGNQNNE